MANPQCKDCFFYTAIKDNNGNTTGYGTCKRYPPNAPAATGETNTARLNFAEVKETEWCGEWKGEP